MNTQQFRNQPYQNTTPQNPLRSGVFKRNKPVEVTTENGIERWTETVSVLANARVVRAADMEKTSQSRGPYRSARVETTDGRIYNVMAYGPIRNRLARLPVNSFATFEGTLSFNGSAAFFNAKDISVAPLHITDAVQEPATENYYAGDPTTL